MNRWVVILVAITGSGFCGCNICCGPYDFDYPVAGGIHQRADPAYGRVGSIFSDPFAAADGDSSDSNLKEPPEPKYEEPERDTSGNADRELEELDREFESERRKRKLDETDDLELIEPDLEDPDLDLDKTEDDSTASERWRPRPLRGDQQWR